MKLLMMKGEFVMTFRQMEIYTAVCECGSITTASREYHISPQGISRSIRDLEEELGSTLLTRSVTGVAVTPRGSFFYDECRRILRWKEGLAAQLAAWDGEPKETIQLGMAYGVISAVPRNLFSGFEVLHPRIQIHYADNTDLGLENQLKRGEYDFCLNTGIMDSDRFTGKTLAREPIMLCIPPGHIYYSKNNINIEDLAEQHFAMFSSQFFMRHSFETACQRAGFKPILDYISSDFNSLFTLSQNNTLLFIMPEIFTKNLNDQCRYIPFPDDKISWDVCLVKNNSTTLNKGAELLWEYIENHWDTP